MKLDPRIFIVLVLFWTQLSAYAESQGILFPETPYSPEQQLQSFETEYNEAAQRSRQVVDVPHFEIPLKLIDIQSSLRFSKEMRDQLVFQKNGQTYVRWLINPEDTVWFQEVQDYFLKEHQIKLEKKYLFKAQQTASRTYHVLNGKGKFLFAFKASTNKTGGRWTNKRQSMVEATDARFVADYVDYLQKVAPFEKVVILDEPAAFQIPKLNMAVIIRDLAPISERNSQNIYLPAFSALHSELGLQIAEKNGATDPNEFWRKHFVEAAATAVGEFAARTGLLPSNPHSQNFLIELNERLQPTGRLVLRDLADFFIYDPMVSALHPAGEKYQKYISQKFSIVSRLSAGLLPFSGTPFPRWLKRETMNEWQKSFFNQFEESFLKTSGLAKDALHTIDRHQDNTIFMGNYEVLHNDSTQKSFWKNLRQFRHPRAILRCERIF